MGAIMGAWGQICEVYDWWCAHVPLLHWEHNYHGGHYRVCSHVITQLWGYSMALARWSNVTHGTRPQIHRAIGSSWGWYQQTSPIYDEIEHGWWLGLPHWKLYPWNLTELPRCSMMMMMIIIIIITENLFPAIFWAFHMSACRRVGFL